MKSILTAIVVGFVFLTVVFVGSHINNEDGRIKKAEQEILLEVARACNYNKNCGAAVLEVANKKELSNSRLKMRLEHPKSKGHR